ncbi:F-box domain-containing protein [Caenorhabditis elegans]|uniref:F-box domain-containing protein n=1 Tax=Caenorhabditis elegans TaxID=6239 RepID=Q9XUM2_CAEEL|nr:F-box domain-containing protein [Caenorhabditis elegans]CAB04904.2 F-box domain-containing protein [Caenorhabditis elegans]|eukprot:NP_493423.2 Uncharacterized protein CELE_W04A8.3 [Caenorhabditis elegans]
MSPPFPICKLPSLPLKEALDGIPTYDLFTLCFTSQKTKQLIKRIIRNFEDRENECKATRVKVNIDVQPDYIEVFDDFSEKRVLYRGNYMKQALGTVKCSMHIHTFELEALFINSHRKDIEVELRQLLNFLKTEALHLPRLKFKHEHISSKLLKRILKFDVYYLDIRVIKPKTMKCANWKVLSKYISVNLEGINISSKQANKFLKKLKEKGRLMSFSATNMKSSLVPSAVVKGTRSMENMEISDSAEVERRSVFNCFRPSFVKPEYKFMMRITDYWNEDIVIWKHGFKFTFTDRNLPFFPNLPVSSCCCINVN